MKAIVHIGTEKTGTSSIQLFLLKNRKKLLRHGYHFLQSAGSTNNWALPAYCSVENRFDDFYRIHNVKDEAELEAFKKRFVKNFEAELRACDRNVHTVIISSEHFHSRLRTDEEIRNVQQLLSRHFSEIKIVCYLREQGATCASWYSTSMKSGGTDSFFDFVRRCRPDNYYFNYLELLNKWESFFGFEALDVALFDPQRFLNGSLLDDFTSRIDSALVGNLDDIVRPENESLNPAGQALARAVNLAFPTESDAPDAGDTRDRLKEMVAGRLSGRGQQLSPSMRRAVYESFIDSNEALRRKFFPDHEYLFPRPTADQVTADVIGEDIFRMLGDMFRELRSGPRPANTHDCERFWAAISTSVGDAVAIRQGLGRPGTQVVLTEDDGRLLNSAANKVVGRDLDIAELLLGLATKANPRLPGLKAKLEGIRKKRTEGEKRNFFVAYHGGRTPHDEDEVRKADDSFSKWFMALDIPIGVPFNPLTNHRVRVSSGRVEQLAEDGFHAFSIVRAESIHEVVAIAQSCPYLSSGGWVEIVQMQNLDEWLLGS